MRTSPMRAATLRSAPSRATRAALVAALLATAAAAWVLTGERMEGMDAGPATDLGTPGWFLGGWVLMMAAMMLPSLAPAALAHARQAAPPLGGSALFAAGYLVPWAAAGVLGYAIVEGVRALDLGFLAWDEAGRFVAAGVILGAALYELTPAKDRCLRHCRHPRAFLARHGHGALRSGIEHGAICVGCCWALMAALFALGVMSLTWMAVVAALIAIEKLLPWRTVASRGTAVVLATLGLAVALAPEQVPGLTVPATPPPHGAGEPPM
jgi:predicted metal-binding membrane protein